MNYRLFIGVFAFFALSSTPAFAHARLDHADPKVGSTVHTSPAEVKLWFTEDVDPADTTLEVKNAAGTQVDKKDLHLDAKDKSIVTISLEKDLPPGKYTVVWHALCLAGHHTKGDFTFEIKGKN